MRLFATRLTAIAATLRRAWSPTSLFAASEPGVWYDPSDMSMMYQDAAGTTPVYMPGQGQIDPPVGLLLDTRLGLTRGPERFGDAAVVFVGESYRVSPGVYRSRSSAGAYNLINFGGALTVGGWYELQFTIDSVAVVGSGIVLEGVTAQSATVGFTTVGRKSVIVNAAQTYIGLKRSGGACDYQISGVSLRALAGNHAYQSTTTSRPTLSARYNLLTNTGWSGAAAGSPGVAPPGWALGFGTASITAVTQVGSDNAIQITAANARLFFSQPFTAAINTTYSISMLVVENTSMPMGQLLGLTGQPSGSTVAYYINGASATASSVPSPGAWIELRLLNGATAGTPEARFGLGAAGPATGVVAVARPDVRVTNDGVGLPPYQRVVDANTYDTAGFPLYLRFDGVDDWLQTANVDFSGTDVVAIATAYRKMSDVSVGEVFALSGSPTATAGTFGFYAPEAAGGVAAAVFFARGASSIISGQRLGTAPISCVAGGWASLSMPYMRYRINQGVSLTSSVATGGGNYGIYPLFIGRRNGTSFPFNGRLYSLLIRGAATPDTTIAKVESYLNQKARIY